MLRRLLSECRWPIGSEEQNEPLQQQLRLPRRKSIVLHSISETTLNSLTQSNGKQNEYSLSSLDYDAESQVSSVKKTVPAPPVKRRTVPVLFSTNSGLHLRVPKKSMSNFYLNPSHCTDTTNDYNITFCDLERWSTNRAHTISLEDTFTIARSPPQQLDTPPLHSLELHSRPHSRFGQNFNSSRFLPVKRAVRIYNAFSRFETRY